MSHGPPNALGRPSASSPHFRLSFPGDPTGVDGRLPPLSRRARTAPSLAASPLPPLPTPTDPRHREARRFDPSRLSSSGGRTSARQREVPEISRPSILDRAESRNAGLAVLALRARPSAARRSLTPASHGRSSHGKSIPQGLRRQSSRRVLHTMTRDYSTGVEEFLGLRPGVETEGVCLTSMIFSSEMYMDSS